MKAISDETFAVLDEPEETFHCSDCGEEKPLDEARQLKEGGAICEDCSIGYEACDCCEFYFPIKRIYRICRDCREGGCNGSIHI